MTSKNLVVLVATAAVLGGVAALLNCGNKPSAPKLNGRKVLPSFDPSAVARIEIGDKLAIAAGDGGWTIDALRGYPADRAKIVENLMKLAELKVGQVVRGRDLGKKTQVKLRDAAGKELAALTLGDRHEKWGFGRYAEFSGCTVLVSDALDAFGDDPKSWCETKIVDDPWISFSELADPSLKEETFGFATGVVAKVTVAGNTNRVATIGALVKGGSDRYLKLDGEKWVFVVPNYSVERLLPKPPEPKKDEQKAASAPAKAEPAKAAPVPVKAEPAKAAPVPVKAEPAKAAPAPVKADPAKAAPVPVKAEPAKAAPAPAKAEPAAKSATDKATAKK